MTRVADKKRVFVMSLKFVGHNRIRSRIQSIKLVY